MKRIIKSIVLCVCVILCATGCKESANYDLYANKRCVICGTNASKSIMGTKAYLATLNPDYNYENYEEDSNSVVITIFYCNDCYYDLADKTVKGIY